MKKNMFAVKKRVKLSRKKTRKKDVQYGFVSCYEYKNENNECKRRNVIGKRNKQREGG